MDHTTREQITYESVEAAAVDGYTVPVTEPLKKRQRANREMIASTIIDMGTLPHCVIFDPVNGTLAVYRKPPVRFVV